MDAALVGLGHLDPPAAGVEQYLANLRDVPRQHRGKTAERVDIFVNLGKPRVDRFTDIVQLGARVGVPAAVVAGREQRGGLVVMLVLDLADNFLDQILDRQQSFGTRIFVDDDRRNSRFRGSR